MDELAVQGLVNTYYLGTTASNNNARIVLTQNGSTAYDKSINISASNTYDCDNILINNATAFRIGTPSVRFDFPFAPELYDYYIYLTYYSKDMQTSFVPNRVATRDYTNASTTGSVRVDFTDFVIYNSSDSTNKGFTVLGKIPDFNSTSINVIDLDGSGVFGANLVVEGLVFCFEKGSQTAASSVVAAINNQTNQLSSDIGQAADDIQQSIEDQYTGEPEEEFAVDDVITQHNEKMGVLSFGSDVMLQFLDMFQSANVGTAELTLPGFNITVENVEYSVWPDYSFNFEQLNEWVPALMSVIRVMLPVFVWLMVLRYCIKVFEDNFLSK